MQENDLVKVVDCFNGEVEHITGDMYGDYICRSICEKLLDLFSLLYLPGCHEYARWGYRIKIVGDKDIMGEPGIGWIELSFPINGKYSATGLGTNPIPFPLHIILEFSQKDNQYYARFLPHPRLIIAHYRMPAMWRLLDSVKNLYDKAKNRLNKGRSL